MHYGQRFKCYELNNNIVEKRFKSYSQGYIMTTDNELIPIENLQAVENFDLELIYPRL